MIPRRTNSLPRLTNFQRLIFAIVYRNYISSLGINSTLQGAGLNGEILPSQVGCRVEGQVLIGASIGRVVIRGLCSATLLNLKQKKYLEETDKGVFVPLSNATTYAKSLSGNGQDVFGFSNEQIDRVIYFG